MCDNLYPSPRFEHECDRCHYLGHFTVEEKGFEYMREVDLYYCSSSATPSLSSLIARYGNDDYQYSSSHPPEAFAEGYKARPWQAELVDRARTDGVYLDPSAKNI